MLNDADVDCRDECGVDRVAAAAADGCVQVCVGLDGCDYWRWRKKWS